MKTKKFQFVAEYLRWGDAMLAYLNTFDTTLTGEELAPIAEAYLADPEVATAIQAAEAGIRSRAEQGQVAEQEAPVLTVKHKRQILYQIATGQLSAEQSYKGKDCNVCSQYVRPTINHMLRAIQIDNQLAGHKPTLKCHNPVQPQAEKTQQKHPRPSLRGGTTTQSNQPSRHAELDSVSGATQTTRKDQNPAQPQAGKTQQKHPRSSLRGGTTKQSNQSSRHAELDSVSSATQNTRKDQALPGRSREKQHRNSTILSSQRQEKQLPNFTTKHNIPKDVCFNETIRKTSIPELIHNKKYNPPAAQPRRYQFSRKALNFPVE